MKSVETMGFFAIPIYFATPRVNQPAQFAWLNERFFKGTCPSEYLQWYMDVWNRASEGCFAPHPHEPAGGGEFVLLLTPDVFVCIDVPNSTFFEMVARWRDLWISVSRAIRQGADNCVVHPSTGEKGLMVRGSGFTPLSKLRKLGRNWVEAIDMEH